MFSEVILVPNRTGGDDDFQSDEGDTERYWATHWGFELWKGLKKNKKPGLENAVLNLNCILECSQSSV